VKLLPRVWCLVFFVRLTVYTCEIRHVPLTVFAATWKLLFLVLLRSLVWRRHSALEALRLCATLILTCRVRPRSRKYVILVRLSRVHHHTEHPSSFPTVAGNTGLRAVSRKLYSLIEVLQFHHLLYGLEVCPLNKTDLGSLDLPVNRFFMKLFNTSDMQTVTECQSICDFRLPSVIIPDRCERFHLQYESCNNLLYKVALSPL